MITTNITTTGHAGFTGIALQKKSGIGEPLPDNYSVQASVAITSLANVSAYIGPAIKISESNNTFYAAYIRADGKFILAKGTPSNQTILEQQDFTIQAGNIYLISLKVFQQTLTATVLGGPTLIQTDGDYTGGVAGIILNRPVTTTNLEIHGYDYYGNVELCTLSARSTDTLALDDDSDSALAGQGADLVVNASESLDAINESEGQVSATIAGETESLDNLSESDNSVITTITNESEDFDNLTETESGITATIGNETEDLDNLTETEGQNTVSLKNETESIDNLNIDESQFVINVFINEAIDLEDEISIQENFLFPTIEKGITEKISWDEVLALALGFELTENLPTDNLDIHREIKQELPDEEAAFATDVPGIVISPSDSFQFGEELNLMITPTNITSGFKEPDVMFSYITNEYIKA